MARNLVVFYSRSGTTRDVAKLLASMLDADIEEIVDPTPRRGILGFLRCGMDARRRRVAPIAASRNLPFAYDLVVVGTPIWAETLASPVRAYLRRHRDQFRSVAFFCTRGGTGDHKAFLEMAEEANLDPIAQLSVRRSELRSRATASAIRGFVTQLRERFAQVLRDEQPHAQP